MMWRILNVLALIAVLVVNYLATSLPLNGVTTAEISDRFPVLFTPAGYVFAIWGLIYLLLIGFVIYQALPGQAGNPFIRRIGALFFLSSLFNVLWLFAWHYVQLPLSMLFMLGLLVTLIGVNLRLRGAAQKARPAEKWLVQLPFSVYLGWISVATIANVSILLYSLGWTGWGVGAPAWTVVMIIVAALLGAAAARLQNDTAFVLVLVWAFFGIGVKQAGLASVQIAAWSAALILVLILVAPVLAGKGKRSIKA